MSRTAALVLLLLLVPVSTALATLQVEERIVVDGRVYRTTVTPLEPLLRAKGLRLDRGRIMATNLYRGYVGTWLLEDDVLHLLSLIHYAHEEREGQEHPVRVERSIPLSDVFGDRQGPIPAAWWSGQIMVPQGSLLREAWSSRNLLHERTLYLQVEKGRVVARRLVDNRAEGRGLSRDDIQWVMQAPEPPEDDLRWHDARSIPTDAFREAVPASTEFRTRGYLAAVQEFPPHLYVARTPATDLVRLPLLVFPETEELRSCPHAELTVVWERSEAEVLLRVRSWRPLEPGETVHHPAFVVPEMPVSRLPAADAEPDPNLGSNVTDADALHALFGRVVSVRGPVVVGEAATIHGVEVVADAALAGKPAVASGLLEKWIVTQALIDRDPQVARIFASRGPGTWYRLSHPRTGRLSRAIRSE